MKKILIFLTIATLLIPASSANIFDDIFGHIEPIKHFPISQTIAPPIPETKEQLWYNLSISLQNANTPPNIAKLQSILDEYNYPKTTAFSIRVKDLDKTFIVTYKNGIGLYSPTEVTHRITLTEPQVKKILTIISSDTSSTSISFWNKVQLWNILR